MIDKPDPKQPYKILQGSELPAFLPYAHGMYISGEIVQKYDNEGEPTGVYYRIVSSRKVDDKEIEVNNEKYTVPALTLTGDNEVDLK